MVFLFGVMAVIELLFFTSVSHDVILRDISCKVGDLVGFIVKSPF